MLWNVESRGFLPALDPINTLPISDFKNTQLIYTLENLSTNMPSFLLERRGREEMVCMLRDLFSVYGHFVIDSMGGESEVERAFFLYQFFANAYMNAPLENVHDRVPKEISIPIARAAHLCHRQPILNYTSYVLYNWRKKKQDGPIAANNIDAITTFTDTEIERLMIASFVEMEADAAEIIKARQTTLDNFLAVVKEVLDKAVSRLNKIKTKVRDEDIQAHRTLHNLYRPFKNVLYEGWKHERTSYDCNVFCQSPLFSLLYRTLGIRLKDLLLQQAEHDICFYRPPAHNSFLGSVPSVRERAEKEDLHEIYDECLSLFVEMHKEMLMASEWKTPRINELTQYYMKPKTKMFV